MQGAMEGFVDIHHHLIYGMDDGAQTWEQTRQMLTSAWKNGIDRIIATPHAERDFMQRYFNIFTRDTCAEGAKLV